MNGPPLSRRAYLKSGAITIGAGWSLVGQVTGQADSEIRWGIVPIPIHGDTSATIRIHEFINTNIETIYIDVQENESGESILSQPLAEVSRQEVEETLGFERELQTETIEANDEVAVRLYSDETRSSEALLDEEVRSASAARVDATVFLSEGAASLDIDERVYVNFDLITDDGRSVDLGYLGISDAVSEIPERLSSDPWTGERPGTAIWRGVQPDEHSGQNSRLVASVDVPRSDPDNVHQLTVRNPERVTDLSLGDVQQEAFIVVEGADTETSPVVTLREDFGGATESPLLAAGVGAATVGAAYGTYRRFSSRTGDEDGERDEQSAESRLTVADQDTATQMAGSDISIPSYSDIEVGQKISEAGTYELHEGTVDQQTVWVITVKRAGEETVPISDFKDFVEDVEAWGRMDPHANLLEIYTNGTDPSPWVAIEPADAPPLREVVDTLQADEILELLKQVCEAVHHVNRYGMTYENLTADSVLFVDDSNIKLRGVLDQPERRHPWYTAPEEFDSESTERSTVYRIGLIAYELFTGTLPYTTYPSGDAEAAIRSDKLVPPSEHVSVPDSIDRILLTALSKDPDDRYETVLHFRDKLQKVLTEDHT